MIKLVVLSLMLVGCAITTPKPPHRWSKLEIALAATYVAASVIDMRQTMGAGGITASCDEQNPLIGKCGGGPVSVPVYFAATYVIIGATGSALHDDYRTALLGALAGIETANVVRNNSLGYGW